MAQGEFFGTYDPKEVVLQIGPTLISGYADGTFITIARDDNEIYKKHVGAGGEVARTRNNNISGAITFSIKSTSPSRIALDILKQQPGQFPVTVINNSNRKFTAAAINAWMKVEPDVEFADEESMIEYVVDCADLTFATLE